MLLNLHQNEHWKINWSFILLKCPPPRSRGRPRMGPCRTRPTSHTDQHCCTYLPTGKCVKSSHCEFREAGRPCMGSCPSANCCNTVHQNPSTWGNPRSGTAPTLTTNVIIDPTRSNTAHPTYCQAIRLVAFHHDYPALSPTTPTVGVTGPSPPSGAGAALAAP